MTRIVFFSSKSGNTARFVGRLGEPAIRIPLRRSFDMPSPDAPYLLVCPTYADGDGRHAVPKPVIHFLNDPARRGLLRGVIAAGNRNFGETFAIGGRIVAAKCQVPLLHRFELAGSDRDVDLVRAEMDRIVPTGRPEIAMTESRDPVPLHVERV